jgi:hypothetical protein
MTVARRFIAGFASTRALEARVPEGRPNTAAHAQTEDPPSKLNRFSHEISIVPPGREQILNTSTGDKSPAYFLVVPPDTPPPLPRQTLKCAIEIAPILLAFAAFRPAPHYPFDPSFSDFSAAVIVRSSDSAGHLPLGVCVSTLL